MNSKELPHPSKQALCDFGLGKLDEAAAESVNRHLGACAECQRSVAEMSSDSFLGRLRGARSAGQVSGTRSADGSASSGTSAEALRGALQTATLPPDLADHEDYEILRELGRGGMGVVYLAHNRLMGRDEVLKVVSKHLMERKGVLERFVREIRSAARLTHPNIVHAYSAFRAGGSVIFAMEYVEGLDLARLVKTKGVLPVAHASNFIYQVALGLQHAHEHGMVHRDIKPGNLMLSRKGDKSVIKVLDFGLAKATLESPLDGGLTHEGQMLGTPDFIAPEQIRDAQSAGIQADIYSLGCTLYYLLTGGPPFHGPSLYDLLQAHFSMDAQPLNLVRPEVPGELAALVAKMMAKDMHRRFQTPGEVAEALKPFFKNGTVAVRPDISTLGPAKQLRTDSVEVLFTTAHELPPANNGVPLAEYSRFIKTDEPITAPVLADRRPPRITTGYLVAAAGAFAAVLLGIVIIIVTKNVRVTIDTGDGSTKIAVDETPARADARPASIDTPDRTREAKPPVPADMPVPRAEAIVPLPQSGKLPVATAESAATEPNTTPADNQRDAAIPVAAVKVSTLPPVSSNTIEMRLALLPAGEFMMGSPDPNASANERPEHKVRISMPFYMGVTEVTQAQYETVTMRKSPSFFSPYGEGKDKVAGKPYGEYPVEQVSWYDAILFCNELSKREGITPYYTVNGETVAVPHKYGPGYRLPTEAEWEYACRGGKSGMYSPGPEPLVEYGWFRANADGSTHPVGKKHPNEFGLYDMAANVWEWCFDEYSAEYYKNSPEVDPMGPTGMSTRVRRGGSGWRSPQRASWWSNRGGVVPQDRSLVCGFRVARTDAPPVKLNQNKTLEPDQTGALAANAPASGVNAAEAKPPAPAAAPDSPEGKLNARGLIRSGAYFVVPAEADVIARVKTIQPLIGQLAQVYGEFAFVLQKEQALIEAEEYRAGVAAQADDVSSQLSRLSNGPRANSMEKQTYQVTQASRDGLIKERDNAARTVEAIRSQQAPPTRKEELFKAFSTSQTEFLKAVAELRPIEAHARDEYRKLKSDPSVKDAIAAYGRSVKGVAYIGPSPQFDKACERVRNALRDYTPQTPAAKRKRPLRQSSEMKAQVRAK